MDDFLQHMFERFHDRIFRNMPQGRRTRKLAIVNSFTNRARGAGHKGNEKPQGNAAKAISLKPSKTCEARTNVTDLDAEDKGRKGDFRSATSAEEPRTDAVTRQRASVESEAEESADSSTEDHVAVSNLQHVPSPSIANLLEEIEADLPSSYSLANMLDHTFHTVNNIRTCARLSRIGTNFVAADDEGDETLKKFRRAESDTTNKLRRLETEAFVQKTLMEQANKIVKLCKVRKKFVAEEDVESLKVLLLANLRHEIINLEIQNLRLVGGEVSADHYGEISVTDVYFTARDNMDRKPGHYICVAFHREHLRASHVKSEIINGQLHFPVDFKFKHLDHNFVIHFELYQLNCSTESKKELTRYLDVKSLLKRISHVNSNTAASREVDNCGFFGIGSASLRLDHVKSRKGGKARIEFHAGFDPTFERSVTIHCRIRACINSKMSGFINLFRDRCWHLVWCCQRDRYLRFWTYPEDEDSDKAPFETLFMPSCRSIEPVTMDVCIRPFSFVVSSKDKRKDILLSAGSSKEMMNWINHLKSVVHHFQIWTPDL